MDNRKNSYRGIISNSIIELQKKEKIHSIWAVGLMGLHLLERFLKLLLGVRGTNRKIHVNYDTRGDSIKHMLHVKIEDQLT